jgi:hypothetical protein
VRKSRRKRIGLAYIASAPRYSLSSDQWRDLEVVAGSEITETVRNKVITAVSSYFERAKTEEQTAFADDVSSEVAKLYKASNELLRLVGRRGVFASNYVQRSLNEAGSLDDLATSLRSVCAASQRALVAIETDDEVKEGGAWDGLVVRLLDILQKSKVFAGSRPPGISNDGTSPYVLFFRALQNTFPPELTRHHNRKGSDLSALARAMNRARAAHRDIKKGSRV